MPPMQSLGAGTAQGLRRGHTGGSLTAVLASMKSGIQTVEQQQRVKSLTVHH